MSTDWSADPDFKYLAVDRHKLMKKQTQAFDGKKACWIPDEKEGFIRADIVSSKGDEITVKVLSSGQVIYLFIYLSIYLFIYLFVRSLVRSSFESLNN